MPGEAIQVGPFIGGLNTFSDPTAIADNELAVCENFEIDLDGSLVSRPPITDIGVTFPLQASGNIEVVGYYYGPGAVPYLIASDGLSKTYYFTGSSWTLITDTFAVTAMVQFEHNAWLVAPVGSANPGGYWSPSSGFVASPNMPKGDTIVANKSRLWISGGRDALSNPTRLYYSNTPDNSLGLWQTDPDFIDIGSGDGESIVRVSVYYNSLIIFRTNSIYAFQFLTDPDAGTHSLLVPNIGLSSKNALTSYQNYIYFIYDEKAYEFVNNRAQQINLKVPFEATGRSGIAEQYVVSQFNNRIIFSFWDTMYVFSTRTRTWSVWRSPTNGPIGHIISAVTDEEFEEAIAFSSAYIPSGGTREVKTLSIVDAVSTVSENFTCTIQTKNYNYQTSSAYKRLFWWGADAKFSGTVTAIASPITFSQSVTWSQLGAYRWADIAVYDWDQPAVPGTDITTVRDTRGAGAVRKFIKFRKSLRFRQIYYRLQFDTDGTIDTAPVRLYALMTYVKAHERVSKAIT